MKIYHDWEFLEDGRTIAPISVGMVAENGDELYCVVDDEETITRAIGHPWLRENVVPHLPVIVYPGNLSEARMPSWDWNTDHEHWPNVGSIELVRERVKAFVQGHGLRIGEKVQLWGWYAAYDHVTLAQLFGPMVDLPEGFPMWTNDLRQEVERLGNIELPEQPKERQHNALMDAWQVGAWHRWLLEYQDLA